MTQIQNPKFQIFKRHPFISGVNPKSKIQNWLACKASDENNKEATPDTPQEYLNCFTTKLDKNGKH
ncbi:MAG: hypothetical protein V7L25_13970 [Nostoc sp.]|uniref:hypothetical protein n=1 Tax=Nostoc sp. TaxID=1180 RepID=UPI002FF29232